MNPESNPQEWIRIADMDISTAHHLFESVHPQPLEIISFHAQQAAEKIMKCFLINKGIEFPKTHDLVVICNMCMNLDASFDDIYTASSLLTRYGVMPRYPNVIELTAHDVEKALEHADEIMTFVKSKITT